MSDADHREAGKFGEPVERLDEGSLLFRPGEPLEDDFGPPEPPKSRAFVLWAIAVGVVLIGVFGIPLLGGDPEPPATTAEAPPLPPGVPEDTSSIAAAIIPIPTDEVQGPIGSSVRVAVRAMGRGGGAMADTLVRFAVESGGGSLQTEEVRTTNDGIAVTFLRLPSRPGGVTVSAAVAGSDVQPARISATALPGPPERIAIAGGNDQEAEVGSLVPERLYVRVSDADGNPVPGTVVTFRVASGEGERAPAQTRTDSLGEASAIWRLGFLAGEQRLTATLPGPNADVTFRATARPQATLEVDTPAPDETSPVTVARRSFAVGGSHACALTNGGLACRGADELGQSRPRGDLGFVAITAGTSHTCALSSTGVASCWGANQAGQLGDGSRTSRASPVRVRTELHFSTLVAGEAHTCGLAGGGAPVCWGENLSGQIGDGTRNNQTVPRTVGGGLGFLEITAGWSHTCGRTASGNTFCWGLNSQGQLGDGTNLDRLQPTLARRSVRGLVAGSVHTCGIAEGQAYCWGGNGSGQLGDGTVENHSEAVPVTGLPASPTALAAGAVHTCALVSDGGEYCWGLNQSGQIGDGTRVNRSTPTRVSG